VTHPTVTDEHRADVARYGWATFCDVDRSIRLYNKLGITEPWNEWEWPRRLAAIEAATTPAPKQEALL
jgi:hypothetical protein